MAALKWWLSSALIVAAQGLSAADSPAPGAAARPRTEEIYRSDSDSGSPARHTPVAVRPVAEPAAASGTGGSGRAGSALAELQARLAARGRGPLARTYSTADVTSRAVAAPVTGVERNAGAVGFRAEQENERRQRWTQQLISAVQLRPGLRPTSINLDLVQMALNNQADPDAPGLQLNSGQVLIAPRLLETRPGDAALADWMSEALPPLGWLAANPDHSALPAMQLLLAQRANPNAAGPNQRTPLIIAAEQLNLAAAELLLAAGADVNARDLHGNSPLLSAVVALAKQQSGYLGADEALRQQRLQPFLPILRLLLRAGADPSLANSRGQNAFRLVQGLSGLVPAKAWHRLHLILLQQEHLLELPWRAVPQLQERLRRELATLAVDDADEKEFGVEITAKDDLPVRPESVLGPRAFATALEDLDLFTESGDVLVVGGLRERPSTPRSRLPLLGSLAASTGTRSESASAQTVPYDEAVNTMPDNPPVLARSATAVSSSSADTVATTALD